MEFGSSILREQEYSRNYSFQSKTAGYMPWRGYKRVKSTKVRNFTNRRGAPMMLVYDLRAMQILFHQPADAGSRPRRVVTIAELIVMIATAQQKGLPKWKRYYLSHREREIARQTRYRAAHWEEVREYKRHYYRNRKQSKTIRSGQTLLIRDSDRGAGDRDRPGPGGELPIRDPGRTHLHHVGE